MSNCEYVEVVIPPEELEEERQAIKDWLSNNNS